MSRWLLPCGVLVLLAGLWGGLARLGYHVSAATTSEQAHGVLPALGALLMIGLLIGQIVEQTTAPYTWFPWVIVAWVVVIAAVAFWLGRSKPDAVRSAGQALGGEGDEIVMTHLARHRA